MLSRLASTSLDSRSPPASATQVAGVIGIHNHIQVSFSLSGLELG